MRWGRGGLSQPGFRPGVVAGASQSSTHSLLRGTPEGLKTPLWTDPPVSLSLESAGRHTCLGQVAETGNSVARLWLGDVTPASGEAGWPGQALSCRAEGRTAGGPGVGVGARVHTLVLPHLSTSPRRTGGGRGEAGAAAAAAAVRAPLPGGRRSQGRVLSLRTVCGCRAPWLRCRGRAGGPGRRAGRSGGTAGRSAPAHRLLGSGLRASGPAFLRWGMRGRETGGRRASVEVCRQEGEGQRGALAGL